MTPITIKNAYLLAEVGHIDYSTGSDCVGCNWPTCSGCPYNRRSVQEITDAEISVWSERRERMIAPSARLKKALLKRDELFEIANERLTA